MSDWHFLVNRGDYRSTRIVEFAPTTLADGDVRVRVDSFGLTANNITYAAAGDMIGYWTFFPAPDTDDGVHWGRVPVWGFAEVVESRCDGVREGERLFGYLPMSTELVMTPTHVSGGSLTDGAPHRASLPPVYNQYERCSAAGSYRAELEAEQMVYRPLFFTSFVIDDFLADNEFFGASTVVLASASSKTAFGTAFLLQRRGDITVVGLTSPGNVEFVEQLGCYDQVATYDDLASLPAGRAVFVDMSGNAAVVRSVHEHYGDDLAHSAIVGMTHWEGPARQPEPMPGPAQTMFFAPNQIVKRRKDWGPGVIEEKLQEVWGPFTEWVGSRVTIQHGTGVDAVRDVYAELLENRTPPNTAHVLHP